MRHILVISLIRASNFLPQGAGDNVNGPLSMDTKKLGEGNEMIPVPRQGHLAAIEVLLHVGITSRSWPRSILIESGTVTRRSFSRCHEDVGGHQSDGQVQDSQGTLHLVSSARAAGPEAREPRATVPILLPASINS